MVVSSLPLSQPSDRPGESQTEAYLPERSSPVEAQPLCPEPAAARPSQRQPDRAKQASAAQAEPQTERPRSYSASPKAEGQPENLPEGLSEDLPRIRSKKKPASQSGQSRRSQFPPRLSRVPRPQNSPYAKINLPPFIARAPRKTAGDAAAVQPSADLEADPVTVQADCVTLEMRPARVPVSNLWHRLRFSQFSPMTNQRRSGWKPGKPRKGRPEGTKGAGSRSL